jgi:hypothetical protein
MSNKNPAHLISIDSETGCYWYGEHKIQTPKKIRALIEQAVMSKRARTYANDSQSQFSAMGIIKTVGSFLKNSQFNLQ